MSVVSLELSSCTQSSTNLATQIDCIKMIDYVGSSAVARCIVLWGERGGGGVLVCWCVGVCVCVCVCGYRQRDKVDEWRGEEVEVLAYLNYCNERHHHPSKAMCALSVFLIPVLLFRVRQGRTKNKAGQREDKEKTKTRGKDSTILIKYVKDKTCVEGELGLRANVCITKCLLRSV